jgi:hypothetical protein
MLQQPQWIDKPASPQLLSKAESLIEGKRQE